jgi:hypothetical protein
MAVSGAKERIHIAVQGWSGITPEPHRFGGTEYSLGRREIGHVHGDSLVDIPFPKKVRNELVRAGRTEPHHILPDSGWVRVYLRQTPDVDRAIELLRFSFEIANQRTSNKRFKTISQAMANSIVSSPSAMTSFVGVRTSAA